MRVVERARNPGRIDGSGRPQPEGLAIAACTMPFVFAAWTVAFIVASGPVGALLGAKTEQSGELAYLDPWPLWLAASAIWIAPLLIGVALAIASRLRRPSGWTSIALIVNALLLAGAVGPAVVDRIS